jgi:hypothetical protein
MPAMTGIELYRHLVETGRAIPTSRGPGTLPEGPQYLEAHRWRERHSLGRSAIAAARAEATRHPRQRQHRAGVHHHAGNIAHRRATGRRHRNGHGPRWQGRSAHRERQTGSDGRNASLTRSLHHPAHRREKPSPFRQAQSPLHPVTAFRRHRDQHRQRHGGPSRPHRRRGQATDRGRHHGSASPPRRAPASRRRRASSASPAGVSRQRRARQRRGRRKADRRRQRRAIRHRASRASATGPRRRASRKAPGGAVGKATARPWVEPRKRPGENCKSLPKTLPKGRFY